MNGERWAVSGVKSAIFLDKKGRKNFFFAGEKNFVFLQIDMKQMKHNIIFIILLIVSCSWTGAMGQRIVRVVGDTASCMGDSVVIGMGYRSDHEVVVENVQTERSHPETAFLPDGVPCGAQGCSYRSAVTFTGFEDGATIATVNDIRYVRLNIEHSYMGDLHINLTCPSGQKVSLLNFGGTPNSSCSGSIPTAYREWDASGTNVSTSTYLGDAHDGESGTSYRCDSSALGNEAGVGWNYCWSSSPLYSYGAGDGRIYRSGNSHGGILDSSHVAAGTQFYHPEQSFAMLMGCPINGTWYIEVMDGWSSDNGYIFDWEMSLDPSLVPESGRVAGYGLTGGDVRAVDDSTFVVFPPDGMESDTVVSYTAHVIGTDGNSTDTVINVHFYPMTRRVVEGQYCMGDTVQIEELTLTETTVRVDTLAVVGSLCPEVREMNVVFMPSYDIYDTVAICYGRPFVYEGVDYGGAGDYYIRHLTTKDCDSNIHLTMVVLDSGFSANPFFTDSKPEWYRDTMLAGCAPFTVWMKDSCGLSVTQEWHTGDTGWYAGDTMSHTYSLPGVYTLTLATTSEHGCRDTAVLRNAVWVYERSTPDFIWAPEVVPMSHPEVEFYAVDSLGRITGGYYEWVVERTSRTGYDSLIGPATGYSWMTDEELPQGDYNVTLTELLYHRGPYGDTVVCRDSVTKGVTIVNDWLQFPNLVSPNGDGVNDVWRVVNLLECGFYSINELWIYSHWGSLVYHAKDIDSEDDFWNPEDTNSPDGTYYFRFSAKSMWGLVRRNGAIEVVR